MISKLGLKKLIREPHVFLRDYLAKHKKTTDKEPLLFGTANIYRDNIVFDLKNKKFFNQKDGFTTLIITDDSKELIHKKYIQYILKNRDFISFRQQKLYFLVETINNNIDLKKITLFNVFAKNKELKENSFSSFRNVVVFNPTTPTFLLIRKSNPNIKVIAIVNSIESVNFLKNYTDYIDILIIDSNYDITTSHKIPRILKIDSNFNKLNFSLYNKKYLSSIYIDNRKEMFEIYEKQTIFLLKNALVDSSYKLDCNLLLPVLTYQDNFDDIDLYNNDYTVQGLIKYTYNSDSSNAQTFNKLVESIDIEELYLRDNLYSIYKDLILHCSQINNYRTLLQRTLNDGVYYAEI